MFQLITFLWHSRLANFDPKQENFNDLLFKLKGTLFRFKILRKINKMAELGSKIVCEGENFVSFLDCPIGSILIFFQKIFFIYFLLFKTFHLMN